MFPVKLIHVDSASRFSLTSPHPTTLFSTSLTPFLLPFRRSLRHAILKTAEHSRTAALHSDRLHNSASIATTPQEAEMARGEEKSSLKRARNSTNEDADDTKRPRRRSARLTSSDDAGNGNAEPMKGGPLPSPVTHQDTAGTVSPKPVRVRDPATPPSDPPPPSSLRKAGLNSPPSDTQPYSQFLPPPPVSYEVEDEEGEGVWGYLVPAQGFGDALVLRKRAACPVALYETGNPSGKQKVSKKQYKDDEERYEAKKSANGVPAGGYLLGRHPECDRIIQAPTVSNRHCLIFSENKTGDTVAVLEDLSGNGTYVNDGYVGRNKRRELHDGDEISVLDEARFIFRYPRRRDSNGFRQQYSIQGQLGKGHFATVYLATEKSSGMRYAVKKFEKRSGPGERSKVEGLQQEIAVLMGVSHPNVLCLKDTFDEIDGVYLVLELAPEGELFNWIVMKHKLSEVETRKVFIQLFQGLKYLVRAVTVYHGYCANSFEARAQHRPS